MANDTTQPGNAPAHLSSQTVPAGNQTQATPGAPNGAIPVEKQVLELQRREKELRKQQESLKGAVTLDSLKERAQKDRNGLLKELGLDDLIQEDLNDPLTSLKKQMEDMRNAQLKKEQDEIDAREFESLRTNLSSKQDDFELVTKLGYESQVHEAIKAYKAEHGEMPDAFQIAKQLEDTLLSQISSLKGTKKLASLFESEKPAATSQRHPLDQSSTMTSSDRTTTASSESAAPTMTRQQQIEALAKHIKFNS